MAGQRNRKGTVAVQSFKGVLRLVWSYQGKQHYLYCGLADTPLNRIVAEGKAKVIQGDLATGNFDPSLAKYKPEPPNQISVVALFQRFMESRQKLIYSRSLEKYKALLNKLEAFFGNKPAQAVTETDTFKFKEKLATEITRHTLVSHALEKGINPVNVAELTGHNVKTLYEHYAGVVNKTKLPDIFADDF